VRTIVFWFTFAFTLLAATGDADAQRAQSALDVSSGTVNAPAVSFAEDSALILLASTPGGESCAGRIVTRALLMLGSTYVMGFVMSLMFALNPLDEKGPRRHWRRVHITAAAVTTFTILYEASQPRCQTP
jgi:hypothetical protein